MVDLLFFFLAIVGSYLGALAHVFEARYSVWESLNLEYQQMLSRYRDRPSFTRLTALFFVFTLALSLAYGAVALLVSIFIFRKKLNHYLQLIARYLLEIPKVYFVYLAFGFFIDLRFVLIIIAVGSLFYLFVRRGLVLQEILLFALNYYLGLDVLTNLSVILTIRLIGVVFFLVPFFFVRYLVGERKYPRQRLVYAGLSSLFATIPLQKLRDRIKAELESDNSIYFYNSGRDSIYYLLMALREKTGRCDVMVPALNFSLIPKIVRQAGFNPVYVDVDDTFTINPSLIERSITKKTKILMVTHMLANPCDMDRIMMIVKKHNLILIEDCAHCFGQRYKGKMLGSFGSGAVFSLHPTKPLHGLYGGFVVAERSLELKRLKKKVSYLKEILILAKNSIQWFALQGMVFDFLWPIARTNLLDKVSEDDLDFVPSNETIGMINASIVMKNLENVRKRNIQRQKLAKAYNKLLVSNQKPSDKEWSRLLYAIKVQNIKTFRSRLKDSGIDTKSGYMIDLSEDKKAKEIASCTVYLPFYYRLQSSDIRKISAIVKKYLSQELQH